MGERPKAILWHDPESLESRRALALIADLGVEVEIVEFLKDPPGAPAIAAVLRLLSIRPRELLRRMDPRYHELELDRPELTDAEIVDAAARSPSLLRRPIVVFGGEAVVARPAERALLLFRPRSPGDLPDGLPRGLGR
jgi:arsenate reductase